MKIIYETQVSESFIVQKVLLAQSHMICLYVTSGWSGAAVGEELWQRPHGLKTENIYYLALHRKFADSYTELLTIISGGWLHGDILLPISHISALNVLISNRYQCSNKNVKLFKCFVGVLNHSRDELNPLILE